MHLKTSALSVTPPDPTGSDIVINCTPLGMAGKHGTAVDPEGLTSGMVVADLVVEPEMTALLRPQRRGDVPSIPVGARSRVRSMPLCTFFEESDHG